MTAAVTIFISDAATTSHIFVSHGPITWTSWICYPLQAELIDLNSGTFRDRGYPNREKEYLNKNSFKAPGCPKPTTGQWAQCF